MEVDRQFDGQLDLAIEIFKGNYKEIPASADLFSIDGPVGLSARDSFYTGVSEGVNQCRASATMLNVVDDELVVDAKGIYSVEKFIIAH